MNKWIALWGCEPGAGRRTLARGLSRLWAEEGKSTLLFTIGPDSDIPSSPNLCDWIERFKSLSPLLLRNYLSRDPGSCARLHLREMPAADVLQALSPLLKRSFERLVTYGPQELSTENAVWLEQTDLLLCVARPSQASSAGLKDLLGGLAAAHLPHAFCQVVLNGVPASEMRLETSLVTLPGRPVLERIAEDSGNGLRLKEGFRRLAGRLEEDALYAPRFSEKDAKACAKVIEDIKGRIQPQLLRVIDQGESRTASKPILEKAEAQRTVEACLAQDETLAATREERGALLTKVLDEVLGLGPLEPLLKDPAVSEVMVNGRSCVYVEMKGRLHPTDVQFSSDTQLRTVIDRIVSPIGRRVDESMPLCDARLADGSRVNIILPPLALDGPIITIRKFMTKAMSVDDLVRIGSVSAPMADFLRACVLGRKNIVVSGGTGSGKTTLLNALSSLIPDDERIVTIEDAAELRLQKPHVVRLESRPANAEGEGAIPIRRLVINALRMRPDRIVVGECRGGEALDMLQAMNTGHDGSLTTVHANSPRDALGRLETLVLMAGMDLPVRVVREQIRSAVHIIIQQARLSDGSRKVTSITEITGMEEEILTTQELFRFRSGQYESTGVVSRSLRGDSE